MVPSVSHEVAQREIRPAFFMSSVHQMSEVEHNFLISHITEILDNETILLFQELGLKTLNDLRTVLLQPGTALKRVYQHLAWQQ
jgi:hypothetical protein